MMIIVDVATTTGCTSALLFKYSLLDVCDCDKYRSRIDGGLVRLRRASCDPSIIIIIIIKGVSSGVVAIRVDGVHSAEEGR